MNYKVALIFIVGIIFSGCSFISKPEPKPQDKNITVVTEIEDNTTQIIPIQEDKIKETKRDKYNFKPEPFSLESNENDPELLGPQTTLDGGLIKKDEDSKELNKDKKENI